MVFAGYRFPKSIVSAGSSSRRPGHGGIDGRISVADMDGRAERSEPVPQHLDDHADRVDLARGSPRRRASLRRRTRPPSARRWRSRPRWPRWLLVSGSPTGSVAFTGSGGTVLCQADLNESSPDTASCDYPASAPTTDSVSASYAGDANYASSASTTPADVTITQATPTTPTISNLPSGGVFGSGFTATVNTNGDGATSVTSSTPSVCASDGLSVSFVGVGPCTLTAQVAAGTDYSGASGDPQSFTIVQGQSATDLSSSANPSVSGQSVTVTAEVSARLPVERDSVGLRHLQLQRAGCHAHMLVGQRHRHAERRGGDLHRDGRGVAVAPRRSTRATRDRRTSPARARVRSARASTRPTRPSHCHRRPTRTSQVSR